MDRAWFAALMARLRLPPEEWAGGLAVAVSGGADSTALALLCARWCADQGIRMLALTCDHGLRAEAALETAVVSREMAKLGVECRVLRLGLSGGNAIQERARNARYDAILHAMRLEGVGILAVGHHLLDQAETIEHRLLAGGTSAASLAGMLPVRVADDALIVRPLLTVRPGILRETLVDAGIGWIDDPSNSDTHYTRVRIRQQLRGDPARISELISIATENGAELAKIREDALERLQQAGERPLVGGSTCLDLRKLGNDAAAAEALRILITRASGNSPQISDSGFLSLLAKGSGTLGGAVLWRNGSTALVAREVARMDRPMPGSPCSMWDGRLRLGPRPPSNISVGGLGEVDATLLRACVDTKIPHRILATLPCIRRGDTVIAVPEIRFGEPVVTMAARRVMPPTVTHSDIHLEIDQKTAFPQH